MMRRIVREPLVHFALLGAILFIVFSISGKDREPQRNDSVIVVDDASLLQFMQFRARAFNEAHFRDRLDAMTKSERELLIQDYIREEALYREAKAMGLETDDYIIRRRLVQKMEFIGESLSRRAVTLNEEDLAAYFDAHGQDYYVKPHVTFTHVFFDAERRGWDEARTMAAAKLKHLRSGGVGFQDAVKHGDRFAYHVNYVEQIKESVSSHFGPAMAESIFSLPPSPTEWHGPFESASGVHLVLLTAHADGRSPSLEEIRELVREDAEAERKQQLLEDAVGKIIAKYDVLIRIDSTPEP